MSVIFHAIVGYDKKTGEVAVEHPVPLAELPYVKSVAGVGADDPYAAMCYKLSPTAAGDIGGAIGIHVNTRAFNYYLEGFDEPVAGSRAA